MSGLKISEPSRMLPRMSSHGGAYAPYMYVTWPWRHSSDVELDSLPLKEPCSNGVWSDVYSFLRESAIRHCGDGAPEFAAIEATGKCENSANREKKEEISHDFDQFCSVQLIAVICEGRFGVSLDLDTEIMKLLGYSTGNFKFLSCWVWGGEALVKQLVRGWFDNFFVFSLFFWFANW